MCRLWNGHFHRDTAPAAILSVTPSTPQTVPASGGFITYTVSNTGGGTMSYRRVLRAVSVASDNFWSNRRNSGTLLVSFGQNTGGQRSGTIQVTAAELPEPMNLNITQAAGNTTATGWSKISGPWTSDFDGSFGTIAVHPTNPT